MIDKILSEMNPNTKKYNSRFGPLEASLSPDCDPVFERSFIVVLTLTDELRYNLQEDVEDQLIVPLTRFLDSGRFLNGWRNCMPEAEEFNDTFLVIIKDINNSIMFEFSYCDGYLEYSYPENFSNDF